MRNTGWVAGLALVLVLCSSVAMADSVGVVIRPDHDSGLYGYAAPANGNTNRGGGGLAHIYTGSNAVGTTMLLHFDLSGIGANEQIVSAKLVLTNGGNNHAAFSLNLLGYPLANTWAEGDGTTWTDPLIGVPTPGSTGYPFGNDTLGGATYNQRVVTSMQTLVTLDAWNNYQVGNAGTAWNTAGAKGVGSDVLNRAMIQMTLAKATSTGGTVAYPDILLTADGINVLNEWHSGTLSNYGLALFAGGAGDPESGEIRPGTRERLLTNGGTDVSAQLIVDTVTVTVPEPATMVLLAIGGMGLAAARRRRTA